MEKTYLCKRSRASILVRVKGEVRRIELESGVINSYGLRGCYYTTSDKEEQKAIEAHEFFGKKSLDGIWTDCVEEHEEETVEQAEEPVKKVRKPKTK